MTWMSVFIVASACFALASLFSAVAQVMEARISAEVYFEATAYMLTYLRDDLVEAITSKIGVEVTEVE